MTFIDNLVFVKKYVKSEFHTRLLYIADILIVEQDSKKINSLKNVLSKSFVMKDLRAAQ